MPDRLDVEPEIAALKGATREAHEAIKDLRAAIRDGKKLLADLEEMIHDKVDDKIGEEVKKGLDEYRQTLDTQIEKATEAVDRRFSTIGDILLGEDAKSRRLGEPSLMDLARALKIREQERGT